MVPPPQSRCTTASLQYTFLNMATLLQRVQALQSQHLIGMAHDSPYAPSTARPTEDDLRTDLMQVQSYVTPPLPETNPTLTDPLFAAHR